MIWKDVPSWEGFYQVSDTGQVRSVDRTLVIPDCKGRLAPRRYRGRILAVRLIKNGYAMILLSQPGRQEHRYVHDLVLLAFVGPKPEGLEVCHWNGVRHDNVLPNLRYGTRSENSMDRHRHGTHCLVFGEACGSAKLTEEDVRYIRANGHRYSFRELGRQLGVAHNTIGCAYRGESWSHVN